ncbi:uncharacterized protein FOMMEDRAFT_160732 [Fomitiporia mediterranea MF3/22]|uniref:uncharacterized protein n=1 Tax=Fomitiporia mediterranea (strain MF3/22) TaxID=694068 RepID=UPI000440780C|nr:uncharacterized protein FOMMEDRAFT_160732 [Fomitiporia mediterranea MF3/22]EJC99162.1 hypothetical protein FOMMEDRAFT_160732 [Fomitiporia mediterranea MF3/22]
MRASSTIFYDEYEARRCASRVTADQIGAGLAPQATWTRGRSGSQTSTGLAITARVKSALPKLRRSREKGVCAYAQHTYDIMQKVPDMGADGDYRRDRRSRSLAESPLLKLLAKLCSAYSQGKASQRRLHMLLNYQELEMNETILPMETESTRASVIRIEGVLRLEEDFTCNPVRAEDLKKSRKGRSHSVTLEGGADVKSRKNHSIQLLAVMEVENLDLFTYHLALGYTPSIPARHLSMSTIMQNSATSWPSLTKRSLYPSLNPNQVVACLVFSALSTFFTPLPIQRSKLTSKSKA